MKHDHGSLPVPKADPSWKIGIVASTYYKEEIDGLIQGAKDICMQAGIPAENISVHEAAGSFEVPLIGAVLADQKSVDALIGFGIIVQGATKHADLLAQESARAIMDVQQKYLLPFAFEILWVNSLEQARERSIGPGNKGEEAARAVLHSLLQIKRIKAA